MDREKNIEEIINGFKLIRQNFRLNTSCDKAPHSLTHSKWLVLSIVGRGKNITISSISDTLAISSSAVTQIINSLEKSGYVKRSIHSIDRRMSLLTLTSKTKKKIIAMRRKKSKEFGKLFNTFTDTEFSEYLRLHKKLIKSIS